jgi:hypothetical protein
MDEVACASTETAARPVNKATTAIAHTRGSEKALFILLDSMISKLKCLCSLKKHSGFYTGTGRWNISDCPLKYTPPEGGTASPAVVAAQNSLRHHFMTS